jgi:hypothetical protein
VVGVGPYLPLPAGVSEIPFAIESNRPEYGLEATATEHGGHRGHFDRAGTFNGLRPGLNRSVGPNATLTGAQAAALEACQNVGSLSRTSDFGASSEYRPVARSTCLCPEPVHAQAIAADQLQAVAALTCSP